MFSARQEADLDIRWPGHAAPDHGIARRRITSAISVTTGTRVCGRIPNSPCKPSARYFPLALSNDL